MWIGPRPCLQRGCTSLGCVGAMRGLRGDLVEASWASMSNAMVSSDENLEAASCRTAPVGGDRLPAACSAVPVAPPMLTCSGCRREVLKRRSPKDGFEKSRIRRAGQRRGLSQDRLKGPLVVLAGLTLSLALSIAEGIWKSVFRGTPFYGILGYDAVPLLSRIDQRQLLLLKTAMYGPRDQSRFECPGGGGGGERETRQRVAPTYKLSLSLFLALTS
jgi:hypothetical protein